MTASASGSSAIPPAATAPRVEALARGRSLGTGVLIGLGVAGFLDETVFHQILHWHHFYDGSTTTAGIVSDGFFHAGSWLAIVVGLFLFADLQRRHAASAIRVWAGGLIGWGGFQVYDGLVQHKLLRLHQVRYGVDLLPYDLTWDLSGALGIVVGVGLLLAARRRHP